MFLCFANRIHFNNLLLQMYFSLNLNGFSKSHKAFIFIKKFPNFCIGYLFINVCSKYQGKCISSETQKSLLDLLSFYIAADCSYLHTIDCLM